MRAVAAATASTGRCDIEGVGFCQLKIRVPTDVRGRARSLASRRRVSLSKLIQAFLEAELASEPFGAIPDESAIREMAILLAIELTLKLVEAATPGGVTLSKRLVEDAARSAIQRIEFIETYLRRAG